MNIDKVKFRETKANCSKADTGLDALVARAQKGDRQALARLLAEARPRGMAVAMKVLRNPSDAEDAVQDAMAKVWRYLPRFEGRASFFTWIHRIVMNTSLDLLRKMKVRGDGREENDDGEAVRGGEPWHEETPEALLASGQIRAVVHNAMDGLSPVHREVLQLREYDDCSYDEIARLVGCPIGTVMSRLHHARRRLGVNLADHARDRQDEISFLHAA